MIPPSSVSAFSFLLASVSLITSLDKHCYFIAKITPVNTSDKLSLIFLPVVILLILSESIIYVRIFPLFHINPAIETFVMTLFFIVIVSFVLPVIARNLGNSLDEATKNLSISEEKFRNLFDNSPLGNSMTGIDRSIHVNKSFCEILGYSEEELNLLTWIDISYPDDIQLSNDYMKALLDGSVSVARFEKRYLHKEGNIVWTDVSIYLQRSSEGKPQYFITTLNDITDRKLAEEKMKSFNQELEKQVNQRTMELNRIIAELEEQSRVFVGRELRMIEINQQLEQLKKQLSEKS
jgi:PAS domain S-box-containing protein